METIKSVRNYSKLYFEGREIDTSCVVRNELNGWRPNEKNPAQDEVVRTICLSDPLMDGIPYMPRQFPRGRWIIGKPKRRRGAYKAPFFIPTNAYQMVNKWNLDEDGGYWEETSTMIRDEDYGLHYSSSGTTLGCIKIEHRDDLIWLVGRINEIQSKGEIVMIEVV